MVSDVAKESAASRPRLCDVDELRSTLAAIEALRDTVGTVNPRPPGWYNDLIQLAKKFVARMLGWYTHPLQEFNASVSRSLEEIVCGLENLSTTLAALDRQLNKSTTITMSIQEQLKFWQEQAKALDIIRETADLGTPAGAGEAEVEKLTGEDSQISVETRQGNDRTAYVIGLFGTGRMYINKLMVENIGERAKYFRDGIRLHPGPTSMIYSGHVTMKYFSRAQHLPAVMSRIREAVRSRFADSIFIYRHPLDSLLTNWVWWRTYFRNNKGVTGISEVYKNPDELSADLEGNFFEFKAFAEGDPDFFAAMPGPRFLSLVEFVEETELHVQSATLTLRLEDFMIDPRKEFSKIAEVMSVDLSRIPLRVAPPRAKRYGYLAIAERVPRFRNFISRLNAETKRRIERIGYGAVG